MKKTKMGHLSRNCLQLPKSRSARDENAFQADGVRKDEILKFEFETIIPTMAAQGHLKKVSRET